jgi:hypothetical protein
MRWTTFIGDEQIADRRLIGITPDGTHRAFLVGDSDTNVFVDGARYEAPVSIGDSWFSRPEGKHFVYRQGYPPESSFLANDGIRQSHHGRVDFTSDENHWATIDSTDVAVDGIAILPNDAQSPHFSFDDNYRFHVFALRGNKLVRIDGYF